MNTRHQRQSNLFQLLRDGRSDAPPLQPILLVFEGCLRFTRRVPPTNNLMTLKEAEARIKLLEDEVSKLKNQVAKIPSSEDIRSLHSALVSKQANLNQLLWQAPVIAFTAQAFLLTIAFGSSEPLRYRVFCGIIATVIGLLSWQLFLRHSAFEEQASIDLAELETMYFHKTYHSVREPKAWFVGQMKSRFIWAWGLFLVSLAGLGPIVDHIRTCLIHFLRRH
jgi:hypothetical protein